MEKTARVDGGSPEMGRGAKVGSWVAQVTAAVILAQTLFFKFTGASEAVHIFSTLGVEPWGRIGTGVFELIAVVLLLWPRLAVVGGAMSIGLMFGALGAHLFTDLGVAVTPPGGESDGGLLFGMGIVVLLCGVGVLALRREQVKRLLKDPKGYLAGRG